MRVVIFHAIEGASWVGDVCEKRRAHRSSSLSLTGKDVTFLVFQIVRIETLLSTLDVLENWSHFCAFSLKKLSGLAEKLTRRWQTFDPQAESFIMSWYAPINTGTGESGIRWTRRCSGLLNYWDVQSSLFSTVVGKGFAGERDSGAWEANWKRSSKCDIKLKQAFRKQERAKCDEPHGFSCSERHSFEKSACSTTMPLAFLNSLTDDVQKHNIAVSDPALDMEAFSFCRQLQPCVQVQFSIIGNIINGRVASCKQWESAKAFSAEQTSWNTCERIWWVQQHRLWTNFWKGFPTLAFFPKGRL